MRSGFEPGKPPGGNYIHRAASAPGAMPERGAVSSSEEAPRFNLLEAAYADRKRRWLALGFSPFIECLALCFAVWALTIIRRPAPETVGHWEEETIVFHLAPNPPLIKHTPVFIKRPPRVAELKVPPVLPKMAPVETAKPKLEQLKIPAVQQPKIELPRTPAPALPRFDSVQREAPKRLVAMVHTGAFNPGSAAHATTHLPPEKVQTGGFLNTTGITRDPLARGPVASVGSFDLPSGPGYGNGTGGAHGARGTVESGGFGNAVGSGSGGYGGGTGTVQSSGFGNAVAARNSSKRAAISDAAFQPVVILAKPDPIYPPEARKLHLEGEVILRIDFRASGEVSILKVVRGLGHGMDEAAVSAAEQIKFKPAKRDGQPVDSVALVHVVFQLAN